MKTFNIKLLLSLLGLSILIVMFFIFGIIMIFGSTSTVYGAEPSPTPNWGYPIITPTISGYPVLEPTENNGYPAPQPTEIGGYPVPIPYDPFMPKTMPSPIIYFKSDHKSEEQSVSKPLAERLEEIVETIFQFIKITKPVEYYGKSILEMR